MLNEKPEQTDNSVRENDGEQNISQDPNIKYEKFSVIDSDGNEI